MKELLEDIFYSEALMANLRFLCHPPTPICCSLGEGDNTRNDILVATAEVLWIKKPR